jgi:hypothetical protein
MYGIALNWTPLRRIVSPHIDTEKPVSRQHEVRYLGYYGYPSYWGGTELWGGGAYPSMMMTGYGGFVATPHAPRPEAQEAYARAQAAQHRDDDIHLRSCKAVVDYHIEATDGDIGHVQGLLVDEEIWAIRYMVVDTSNWWLGHKVLVAPARRHRVGRSDPAGGERRSSV